MLKKTTIAVLGLAASGLATAGAMGPVCTPGNVTVPCEARQWYLGADALYLRSIYTANKGYLLQVSPTTGGISPTVKDVSNDWDWGYRLMGAYSFNTGNDVTVNWTHFSTTADQSNVFGPLPVTIGGVSVASANYSNSNRLDQVNLVMGQHVDISMRDRMRFYAGLQYANIQSNSQTYLTNPLVALAIGYPVSVFDNTDFTGFGPSAGIDYSYDLMYGFSVTANGSGSLVYGTTHYHEGFVLNPINVIAAQISARKRSIVPSLEAKLGLNYAHPFGDGMVSLNAGYQVMNYFNALNAQAFQSPTAQITSVNYGLFGPYFGLKYVGNA